MFSFNCVFYAEENCKNSIIDIWCRSSSGGCIFWGVHQLNSTSGHVGCLKFDIMTTAKLGSDFKHFQHKSM